MGVFGDNHKGQPVCFKDKMFGLELGYWSWTSHLSLHLVYNVWRELPLSGILVSRNKIKTVNSLQILVGVGVGVFKQYLSHWPSFGLACKKSLARANVCVSWLAELVVFPWEPHGCLHLPILQLLQGQDEPFSPLGQSGPKASLVLVPLC